MSANAPTPRRKHAFIFSVIALLALITTGVLLAPDRGDDLTREDLRLPDGKRIGAIGSDNTLNIAILGVGGGQHAGGHLADTVMLASIDTEAARAVLFSIPRDLYLTLGDGSHMRINRALAPAPDEPADTYAVRVKDVFQTAFELPVDHFVRLDFAAFVTAVDVVGGVDVNFDAPLYDEEFAGDYGVLDYPPGLHHLDGAAALHVARSRKTSSGGDLDRAARQRAILLALKDRLIAVDALANPTVLSGLFAAQQDHVQTDLGVLDLMRLYNVSRDMDLERIHTLGFEDSPEPLVAHANIGGAAVLVPAEGDFSRIRDYLHNTITERLLATGS
jgi:LCP family protein required for cell wall assembly